MSEPLVMVLTLGGLEEAAQLLISANERQHWRVKARLTKYWRHRAGLTARGLMNKGAWTKPGPAHVLVTITWPDQRRRDPANWAPTAKAIVDGLVDAGVFPDDNDHHVTGPDMRRGYGPTAIHITITPQETPCPSPTPAP